MQHSTHRPAADSPVAQWTAWGRDSVDTMRQRWPGPGGREEGDDARFVGAGIYLGQCTLYTTTVHSTSAHMTQCKTTRALDFARPPPACPPRTPSPIWAAAAASIRAAQYAPGQTDEFNS